MSVILTKSSELVQEIPQSAELFSGVFPNYALDKLSVMNEDTNIQIDARDMTIGQRAEMIRASKNISYADIGRALGMSDVAVRKWMLTGKRVELSRVRQMAKVLDVEEAWLLTGLPLFWSHVGYEAAILMGGLSREQIDGIVGFMKSSRSSEN